MAPGGRADPISLYLSLVGDRPGILLESAEVDGGWALQPHGLGFPPALAPRDGRLGPGDRRSPSGCLRDLEGLPYLEGVRRAMSRLVLLSDESVGELPA
jgi:anthranilate synthase component 1